MNPTTGTFISMDTYQGTIFDPTSLHKYLYANANPIMYTDPSGYFGLADFSVSSAMSNAISTVQNDAFAMAVWRSFKAGFVCAGLDVYRQLRTNGAIDWGHVIETFFVSSAVGVVFGGSAILAATLKSAAIYTALGGACFTFFGVSLAQAMANGDAGYYDLMLLDLVFSALSLKGANDCFNAAYQTATAYNTAKSTTDTSVGNTNTSKSSNNSSNNNSSLQTTKSSNLSTNAESSYNAYKKAGWKNHSAQTPGTKAGKVYSNDGRDGSYILPEYDSNGNQIKYYEYDVNNRIQGMPRDGERFVRDDTGNIYYTNDHYRTFIQIVD